jgi:hypothetical protein
VSLSADGVYALVGGHPSAVFSRRYGSWSQLALLPGTGPRVALTSNGDTAFTRDADAVLRYRRIADNWVGGNPVTGSDVNQSAFGVGLAVSHDRTTALFGGPHHDSYKGAAWSFVRDPGSDNWIEQAKLTPSDAGGFYGYSVALSADGNTALIGALHADHDRGAVYTYMRERSRYLFVGKLVSPDRSDRGFGGSVALSHDGGTALISDGLGVRAFLRSASPPGWNQDGDKLTGRGTSVALSADGTIALIGDLFTSRAWLWLRAGAIYELTPPEPIGYALLGQNVALAPDGNTALIDAMYADNARGAAWLFITPLAISSVGPTSGPAAGGTTVTISGTGFNGATRVRFGTTPAASFIVNGATQITAVSPPRPTGTVNVSVTTSVGTSEALLASQFTFL